MRFLVNNALSAMIVEALRHGGHDAIHVLDRGLQSAEDSEIFDLAVGEDRVIVSADTDFGALLAARRAQKPSVILFRGQLNRRPQQQSKLLLSNLDVLANALDEGCVAVFDENRIRLRSLPLGGTPGE